MTWPGAGRGWVSPAFLDKELALVQFLRARVVRKLDIGLVDLRQSARSERVGRSSNRFAHSLPFAEC